MGETLQTTVKETRREMRDDRRETAASFPSINYELLTMILIAACLLWLQTKSAPEFPEQVKAVK